ncbi:MAG: hypothetical protein ABI333_22120 [bacterium]
MNRFIFAGVLPLLALAAGCLESGSYVCETGIVCPPGLRCAPGGRVCYLVEQITACEGESDDTPCDYVGSPAGAVCQQGVCLLGLCGDGALSASEECDDGNRETGDGCDDLCEQEPLWQCTGAPSECRRITQLTVTDPVQDLDLLLVVDNSGSMENLQTALARTDLSPQSALGTLLSGLRSRSVDANLHVGVTSTDLGTGMYSITYCEGANGDGGELLTSTCPVVGANYLIDVSPVGCTIERSATGECTSHDCTQANCDQEPATSLELEQTSACPRCRNFGQNTLADTLGCLTTLGTLGCGFEQPLEAMYLALADNPGNAGFVRESAALAVILVTDEDDCSASDPILFDTTQNDINSELGPLTSFRCFEFGIQCDVNDRLTPGARQNCAPRDDPEALLHPIRRYLELLQGLPSKGEPFVAAIAGPVCNASATITLDDYSHPMLSQSCALTEGETTVLRKAVPAIRINALVEAANPPELQAGAFNSVCDDVTSSLDRIGRLIAARFFVRCLNARLLGCVDPGAEAGFPADGCSENDTCLPSCEVTQAADPLSTPEPVPPCLEVCDAGPCEGNTSPGLAYRAGHPPPVDPSLPVSACWHILQNGLCPFSAELQISRSEAPASFPVVEATCDRQPEHETSCDDQLDDDADCLVDCADPDCARDPACASGL